MTQPTPITASFLRAQLQEEFKQIEEGYLQALLSQAQENLFEGTAEIEIRLESPRLLKWWGLREGVLRAFLQSLGFEVQTYRNVDQPAGCLALYSLRISWDLIEEGR